jgi:hypothetical protein
MKCNLIQFKKMDFIIDLEMTTLQNALGETMFVIQMK